jgi:hypothetical protein
MIRQPRKGGYQMVAKGDVFHLLGQRLGHAHHPLVFGAGGDGVGGVAHAHAGVTFFVGVHRGAAKPAAEVFKQVLLTVGYAFRVQAAHLVGFGQLVHELVKTMYEATHASFSA